MQPLEEGLEGYRAWATGLRRDESPTRANTPVVGWDDKRRKVKVSPIARWTQDDVDAYVAEHGVLTNPLLTDGYASIGCAPAPAGSSRARTRAPAAGPAAARPSADCTDDDQPPGD